MGFFDKVNEAANKLIKNVDEATQKATDIYREKGVKGILEVADAKIGEATEKTKEYFNKAAEEARTAAEKYKNNQEKEAQKTSETFKDLDKTPVAPKSVPEVEIPVAKKAPAKKANLNKIKVDEREMDGTLTNNSKIKETVAKATQESVKKTVAKKTAAKKAAKKTTNTEEDILPKAKTSRKPKA